MFCPNCGHPYEKDSVFCENCGYRLTEDQPSQQDARAEEESAAQSAAMPDGTGEDAKVPEQVSPVLYGQVIAYPGMTKVRTPLKKRTVVLLICIIAVAAAAVSAFLWARQQTSPETIAQNYFQNIMKGNYSAAYQAADLPSGVFITEKQFAADAKEALVNSNAELVNCRATSVGSSDLTQTISVQYMLAGQSSVSTVQLTLEKQKTNTWLLFPSWKVSAGNLVVKNYQISAPSGATVYLDGVKLGSSYLSKDSSSSGTSSTKSLGGTDAALSTSDSSGSEDLDDEYVIPELFYGPHSLKVTTPYTKTWTDTLRISNGDRSYSVSGLTLSSSAEDTLVSQAKTVLEKYYAAIIAGSDFSSIKSLFTDKAISNDNIEEYYNDMLSEYGPSSTYESLKQFSISDMKADSCSLSDSGTEVDLSAQCTYDLTYNTMEDTGSFDSSGNYTPGTTTQSSSNTATEDLQFIFVYQNGSWQVAGMSGY